MATEKLTHPNDNVVWACPDCDSASQVYRLDGGEVSCYDCGTRHAMGDMVQRGSRRGDNLTREVCARGGRATDNNGNVNGYRNAKYAELTLADVGLDD